jgi:hypothetical protein
MANQTFTSGQILTAAQMMMLQSQTVQSFATVAARNAWITAPTQGQLAYTNDVSSLWSYDGTNWLPINTKYQTWAPSYTNLTIGNGTVVARYFQIGKFVDFIFEFTLGSTSSVGSAPVISLPVAGATTVNSWNGTARFLDSGVTNFMGALNISSTGIRPQAVNVSGTYADIQGGITATVPMTWTTGDVLSIGGTYEAT